MTSARNSKGLLSALVILVVSNVAHAQQASNFGAQLAATIRDCTGIAPLDSCIWPGGPPHQLNQAVFSNFTTTTTNQTVNVSEPDYGSATAGVEFGGDLFTPTLANAASSASLTRNGASVFSWQVVTYTGTAPVQVPFGGDYSYTKTGTVDSSCVFFKDVDTGGFQFQSSYNKDECGGINVQLRITDLELEQVIASESLQSINGEISSPTTVQTTIEMIPGRPYEIYAVVQTITRGVGQMIDSTNSFEIGLVDPVSGTVTKDIPDSLPQLKSTLIPASDESQPAGIEVDVLPGSTSNPIRVGRRGVIVVALITTPGFYAPDVDRETLQFGPGASLVVGNGGGPMDVDNDGDLDYVVHFGAEEAGFSCGDTTAYLSGLTISDDIIIGSDTIEMKGCP